MADQILTNLLEAINFKPTPNILNCKVTDSTLTVDTLELKLGLEFLRPIPVEELAIFNNTLKKSLVEKNFCHSVVIKYDYEEKVMSPDLIKEYYRYTLDKLIEKKVIYRSLDAFSIDFMENEIKLWVGKGKDMEVVKPLLDMVEKGFIVLGLDFVKFNIEVNALIKESGKTIDSKQLELLIERKNREHEKEIIARAKQKVKVKKEARDRAEAEVIAAGGLKVIGSGHFQYRRVDNQVKGRCGRQGNPGEVIFFNDLKDLERIGLKRKELETAKQMLKKGPVVEKDSNSKTPLGDLIYSAQARNEANTKDAIDYNQKIEISVSMCREDVRKKISDVKRNNNYDETIKDIIDEVVADIIHASTENKHKTDLDRNTKLSRIGLDTEQLILLVDEFLGAKITEEQIEKCDNCGNLYDTLDRYSRAKYERESKKDGFNAKKLVDERLNRTWFAFEDIVEKIKNQYRTVSSIPGNNPPKELDPFILDAYDYCYESMTSQIVRAILNPNYLEKHPDDHIGLTEFYVNSDASTERVSHLEAKEREKGYQESTLEVIESVKKTNINNINVPKFREFEDARLKLVRERTKLGETAKGKTH